MADFLDQHPAADRVCGLHIGLSDVKVHLSGGAVDALLAWHDTLTSPSIELYDGEPLLVYLHGTHADIPVLVYAGVRGQDREFLRAGAEFDNTDHAPCTAGRLRELLTYQTAQTAGGAW